MIKSRLPPRCALCLLRKPLRSSHIIPKFIYQIVRRNQPYEKEHEKVPVVVSNESGTIQKDVRQYKRPLFCETCEELFSAKETAMAAIISNIAQGFSDGEFMGYGGEGFYDQIKEKLKPFFTPQKISAMKYFFLSCVFRQVIAEKRSINKAFLKGTRRYLLGKNPSFGVQLIIKVNSGESLPMATSIALSGSGSHTHGLILVPDFLMHLILDEQNPILTEDQIIVTPEDFDRDTQVNQLCLMNADDYKIASRFQEYLDRLRS